MSEAIAEKNFVRSIRECCIRSSLRCPITEKRFDGLTIGENVLGTLACLDHTLSADHHADHVLQNSQSSEQLCCFVGTLPEMRNGLVGVKVPSEAHPWAFWRNYSPAALVGAAEVESRRNQNGPNT